MKEIYISDDYIKLGQAIKLSGLSDNGVIAKQMIIDGKVRVNGDYETRRGRKLYDNDYFTLDDESVIIKVVKKDDNQIS